MACKTFKVMAGFGLAGLLVACAPAPKDEGLIDPQTIAQAFTQEADAAAAPVLPEPKKNPFSFLRKKPEPAAPALLEGKDITVISDAGITEVIAPEGAVLDVVPEAKLADASIDAPKSGLFGFLRRKPIVSEPDPIIGLAQEQARTVDEAVASASAEAPLEQSDTVQTIAALDVTEPTAPRRGFAALFKKAPEPAALAPIEAVLPATPEAAPKEIIAALPQPSPSPEVEEKPARRGLFGPRKSSASRGGKSTVARGEVLPFGQVGVACGLRKSEMGREVDRFPKEGKAQWFLFDTSPASTGPRTQFITGFSDKCARQFTASLALFGAPALHETHRYSSSQRRKPYSQADTAYEAIKSRLCGVGRGKRCPASKIGAVEKKVAFVSIYNRFGDTKGWLELLLNNGKLQTQQVR